jgi:hypothetical protein
MLPFPQAMVTPAQADALIVVVSDEAFPQSQMLLVIILVGSVKSHHQNAPTM